MLKIPYQKLRLSSKGNLKKCILQGIPVLSIFALVGILSYSIGLQYTFTNRWFGIGSSKAYAEEGIMPLADTSASLTVDDGKIKDTIFATNGEFAYASHKITVEATNVKSYTLTLTRNTDLSGPSTVNGAAGKTPVEMDNAWGYAFIDTTADPTTASYSTVNATNTLTGPAINTTTHNVSGSKQLVFGAKFGNSAINGTYHAEATLSMVATPRVVTNYVVNVNCNGGSNCTSPLNTSSDAESYTYTISSTTPTRSGYKFLGYNTSNTTTANASYAPGKTVTLTAASPTLTLYAIWQQDIQGIKSITNMQQMTAAICKASAVGDTNTLTDTRDSSKYTVTKLADGNCWMTQNLRLTNEGLTANGHSASIDSSDSDMTSGSFTIPASSTSGFSSNTASNAYYPNDTTKGAYYTWCAATAGNCSSATAAGTNATNSICPKGWKLPVGGTGTSGANTGAASDTKNDFMVMAGKISTSGFTDASLVSGTNITLGTTTWPFAGNYSNSAPDNVGTNGYYWSRTAYSSTAAYYLYVRNNGFVSLANSSARLYGFSVRCVAYSS